MLAAIDAGSNTLRLLIGEVIAGKVAPKFYQRRICRLVGGFSNQEGLSQEARERTLSAFQEFAKTCRKANVRCIKAVGTAAFRQAVNGDDFAREVRDVTFLPLEIISGDTEASCMAAGVLCALDPVPEHALIVDIGGGSTEFVLCAQQQVVWSRSLPLGVVRLTEGYESSVERRQTIETGIAELYADLAEACKGLNVDAAKLSLVGTAGTVTTVAALDMQMTNYDWQRVNNYSLSLPSLQQWQSKLMPLSPREREALPGMEPGRGDLITSGLDLLLTLMLKMKVDALTVSDFGILEGLLLSMDKCKKS